MTEEYNKLVRAVELKAIVLTDLSHHRELNLRPPLQIKYEFSVGLESFSEKEFVASAEFSLDAFPKNEEKQKEEKPTPGLSIRLTYHLIYVLSQAELEPSEELIREFLDRNVPINVWPFIRETVATLTAKMGLSPLILPTLKITR